MGFKATTPMLLTSTFTHAAPCTRESLPCSAKGSREELPAPEECSVLGAHNHQYLWKRTQRGLPACDTVRDPVSSHTGTAIQTEIYSQCSGWQEYTAPCPLCGTSKHLDLLWPSAPDVWQFPQPSSAGERETTVLKNTKGHREFKMQDNIKGAADPFPFPEKLK